MNAVGKILGSEIARCPASKGHKLYPLLLSCLLVRCPPVASAGPGLRHRAARVEEQGGEGVLATALSQPCQRQALPCRPHPAGLHPSCGGETGPERRGLAYVPAQLPGLAGLGGRSPGRAAEAHAARADRYHDGYLRRLADGSQAGSQQQGGQDGAALGVIIRHSFEKGKRPRLVRGLPSLPGSDSLIGV